MIWLVLILIHGVLCVAMIADLASLWMPPRARAGWFVAAMLLPVIGIAAYVLFARRRWAVGGAQARGWPDLLDRAPPDGVPRGTQALPASRRPDPPL